MKSNLLVTLFFLCTFFSVNAQLSNGTIAPDFTLTDMNGYEHSLYQDYLDQGYTVFIDFSPRLTALLFRPITLSSISSAIA